MAGRVTLDKVDRNESFNLANILANYDENFGPDDIFKLSLNSCHYHSPGEILKQRELISDDNIFAAFGLNCRGLTTNFDHFQILMNEMTSSKFSYDVIGLSELHSVVDTFNYKLEGYHKIEVNPRPDGDDGKGGWLCIFRKTWSLNAEMT